MMRKVFRKTICLLTVLSLFAALSGCSSKDVDTGLSQEDEELVAEYAAGLLLKNSAREYGGLSDYDPAADVVEQPVAEEAPAAEPAPEETAPEPAADEAEPPSENDADSAPNEVSEVTDVSEPVLSPGDNGAAICEAIGISGLEMSYTGYEVADVYPEPDGNELSFSMQSTEGRKLLVVHFDLKNPDSSDKMCSVLDNSIKFRILINDSERVNEQMTILLNDLKSYSDTIPAGQTVDTVLVFEVDDNVAADIGSLALIVINSEGESQFKIK
ncbi:MAG: hypothetical protein K6E63_08015 [Lachnospiraceae bacterium]|nr:hypothetical protein [Lachnospiraceae bacterium]